MNLLNRFRNAGDNTVIVIKNVIGAFFIKGGSMIVSLITTPLFISYFDNNKVLGIWYTLLSILFWFLNFDLGIGNGIRNNLVKDLTANDYSSARRTISSGMFAVGVVTIILSFVGYVLIDNIDLYWLYSLTEDTISYRCLFLSTIFVFIAVMLRFFLTTITSIFYALQKSAVNNLLALCASVLQLLYVLIADFDSVEEALISISFAYIFLSNIPTIVAGIIVFCKDMRQCIPTIKCIDKLHLKAITSIGALFFLCQILYMIISNTNEFFITNLYGSEYTTEYTFYHKLTTIVSMLVSLSLTPIWSVVTKAQTEGNFGWLDKLYSKIKFAGFGLLLLQFAIVPFIPFLMNLWLGDGVVEVNYITAVSFACFSSIFLYSGMLSTIANGLAMMRIQTLTFLIAVFLKIFLLGLFHQYTKWDFVVWVNVIILLPYVVAQQLSLNHYFKKKLATSFSSI